MNFKKFIFFKVLYSKINPLKKFTLFFGYPKIIRKESKQVALFLIKYHPYNIFFIVVKFETYSKEIYDFLYIIKFPNCFIGLYEVKLIFLTQK